MVIGEELLQLELPLVDNLSDTYIRFLNENTSHHESRSVDERSASFHPLSLSLSFLTRSVLRNWNKNGTIIFSAIDVLRNELWFIGSCCIRNLGKIIFTRLKFDKSSRLMMLKFVYRYDILLKKKKKIEKLINCSVRR